MTVVESARCTVPIDEEKKKVAVDCKQNFSKLAVARILSASKEGNVQLKFTVQPF